MAKGIICPVITDSIRNLAKGMQGETPATVAGLIGIWQRRNNTVAEPTIQQLTTLKQELRKSEDIASFEAVDRANIIAEQEQVDIEFQPHIRRFRTSLIARMFSTEIDRAQQEYTRGLQQAISESDNPRRQADLQEELNTLDRRTIIDKYTPAGIFQRVKDKFDMYLSFPEGQWIEKKYNELKKLQKYSNANDETIRSDAVQIVRYTLKEYDKLSRNFNALAEEASQILLITENLRVSSDYNQSYDADLTEDDPNGENYLDEANDDNQQEEKYKEGWMENYRHVSPNEALSQEVRKMLRSLPNRGYDGKIKVDDLGNVSYLDADYAHAVLIDKLSGMASIDDMIPMLTELSKSNKWVTEVINLINNDPTLYSKFYQDFRKDFLSMWIQKRVQGSDGRMTFQTVQVNKPNRSTFAISGWRYNIESGTILDEDSIYKLNGSINRDNARKGLNLLEDLTNQIKNKSTEARLALVNDDVFFSDVIKLLNMLGINTNPAIVKTALENVSQMEGAVITEPIVSLFGYMNVIYNGVLKGTIQPEEDLINTFDSAYTSIATMFGNVTEDAVESSARENGKSYYSYVTPSYMGKIVKLLKNSSGNINEFKSFIENEYGIYDFFYKTNNITGQKEWMNDWIEQLLNDPDMRKGFNHKAILNGSVTSGKTEYQGWNDLDYAVILMNEYFAESKDSDKTKQFAWYHVPIMADTQSAEFIRFRKYTNVTGGRDENGEWVTYQEQILDKMVNIVAQEYDRIKLVQARDRVLNSPNPTIKRIASFDIVRDKEGKIKNPGGSIFKFLPALNELRDDYYFGNNKTFIENLGELGQDQNDALEGYIKASLTRMLEDGFEQEYKKWSAMGMFEEAANGGLIYITEQGQTKHNTQVANYLNGAKVLLGSAWTQDMEHVLAQYNSNNAVDDRVATQTFNQVLTYLQGMMDRGQLSPSEMNNYVNNLTINNPSKEKMREYYWNSQFATSQIIQILTTDLAFYKDLDDWQKRAKEYHAPALKLNTNSKYGKKFEKTIYIADQEDFVSNTINDIDEVLQQRVDNGLMLKVDKDKILNKFREINVADAQAYRTLDSYRSVMDMSGQWTEAHDRAYENFMDGKWDGRDFEVLFQPLKPFVFTQTAVKSGIEGTSDIKVPVQHKNAEYLLLAAHELIAGTTGKSAKLKTINEYMLEKGIDVVQFESTTKVGKQGVININNVESAKDIRTIFDSEIYMPDGEENSDAMHIIDYEDYGIQQPVPEHSIDAKQLVGTQFRALIAADISPNIKLLVDNNELTPQEWVDLYNALIAENVISSYEDLREVTDNAVRFNEEIQAELKGSPRYGIDLIRAASLREDGKPTLPYYEPTQSQRIQSLISSIVKNRITKQKIKGGSLVQVSNYGLTDELSIVFEGEGANKRIKHFEAYMPWWSAKYFPNLVLDKNGVPTQELDINEIPDELRRIIGYRIPTEDKYSMIPIYVKGFLPQQSGGAIMLPADITTLSGSDFDIDKLYVMIPEFKIKRKEHKNRFVNDTVNRWKQEYGGKVDVHTIKAWKDEINMALDTGVAGIETDERANAIYQDWLNSKAEYSKTSIEKVKYDMKKTPQEQSVEARNNMFIDLAWSILTNADTAPKMLNPGNFDAQKHSAAIVTILQNMTKQQLFDHFKIDNVRDILPKLRSMSVNQAEILAKSLRDKLNPLSPYTQVALQQRNMTGAKMISIAANHNKNHALMQHTQLALSDKGAFTLNGHRYTSLHNIMNDAMEYISKNMAGYLAASVDNGKDPVLGFLNVNEFTADTTFALIRLGYSPIEVSLFMSQPIIMEMTRRYFREGRNGKPADIIADEVMQEYKERAEMIDLNSYDNFANNKFLIDDLAENILIEKEMSDITHRSQTADGSKIDFYKKQVSVGMLFQKTIDVSKAVGDLTQAVRADTGDGGAGPSIADTQVKIQRVVDFYNEAAEDLDFPLENYHVVEVGLDISNIDELRERIKKAPIPFVQAFYTLGLEANESMLSKYFPQFSDSFQYVISELKTFTKGNKINSKTMNQAYNDLLAYIMSDTEFFGDTNDVTTRQKRNSFIHNFPKYFNDVIANNTDIASLEFVKRLRTVKPNSTNPVATVVFNNVGKLTPSQKDKYMRDWSSLLYMENPDAQQFALKLFRYSFYRNGFAFGPTTFIHLAPTTVKLAIPEYVDTLEKLLENKDNAEAFAQFPDQFVRNHLDNRALVAYVSEDSTIPIVDSETRTPYDSLTIEGGSWMTSSDRKLIKKIDKKGDSTTYKFRTYVAFPYNGNYIFYRLVNEVNSVATYDRIEPLGARNSFIEYEFGVDGLAMGSVIAQNDINYVATEESEDTRGIDNDTEWDPHEDGYGFGHDNTKTEVQTEPYAQDMANIVGEFIYDENLDVGVNAPETTGSLLEYEPYTDYTDDNGDTIC